MNPKSLKSLDRLLAQLERRARRPKRRFTTAPLMLAAGLFLADQLLVRLVPAAWPVLLDSAPGETVRGWPLLVWKASLFCQEYPRAILAGIVAVAVVGLWVGARSRLVRWFTWLAALAVVFANAGIILATIRACYDSSGLGFF